MSGLGTRPGIGFKDKPPVVNERVPLVAFVLVILSTGRIGAVGFRVAGSVGKTLAGAVDVTIAGECVLHTSDNHNRHFIGAVVLELDGMICGKRTGNEHGHKEQGSEKVHNFHKISSCDKNDSVILEDFDFTPMMTGKANPQIP
jgi:hypothetical protein